MTSFDGRPQSLLWTDPAPHSSPRRGGSDLRPGDDRRAGPAWISAQRRHALSHPARHGAAGVPAIPPGPQRRPQPAAVPGDAVRPEGAGDRQAARAGTVRRNVRAPVMAARILALVTWLCPALASAQGTCLLY